MHKIILSTKLFNLLVFVGILAAVHQLLQLALQVNGRRMNLPVFIERKISIQSSGGYVLLETDFGLWVRYDGNHYAEVSVPSDYSGLLCGLCGKSQA